MKSINAIIVDDEQDARDVLQTLISFSSEPINIIASCSNVLDAVQSIKSLKPDVVFLDVQMPNYAGYEIVNFFDEINFEIIFVTAYDKYALKAFELSAIDYLVKPIKRERLQKTLIRLFQKLEQRKSIDDYKNLLESIQGKEFQKIVIPEVGNKRVLKLTDIICIEGNGSYSIIHMVNEPAITTSKTLKYFEGKLPEDGRFFRSQKSWIINLSHIKQYSASHGNIEMTNQVVAKLSKNHVDEFSELI